GQLDHIARLDDIRRDVHALAIDQNRVVTDQLARLGARSTEAHAVHDGVETTFEQLQQVLTGLTAATIGFREHTAELTFQHAIQAADLLLFTQLNTVAGHALTRTLAMLTRSVGTALNRALVGETLLALQKQLFAFATALTALGIKI